jgi:hypothetical protein
MNYGITGCAVGIRGSPQMFVFETQRNAEKTHAEDTEKSLRTLRRAPWTLRFKKHISEKSSNLVSDVVTNGFSLVQHQVKRTPSLKFRVIFPLLHETSSEIGPETDRRPESCRASVVG